MHSLYTFLMISFCMLFSGCMSFSRPPEIFDAKLVVEEPHVVQLLDYGHTALLTRIHLIRGAKKSITIQTFMWADDEVGRLLFYELLQAVERGVKVRIIADHMFSAVSVDSLAFASIAHPNLEIRLFKPGQNRLKSSTFDAMKTFTLGFRNANMRMHNKVFVADDWAITGGRNIENCYYDRSTKLNFKDRDVLVKGPVVEKMSLSFEKYWNYPLVIPSRELKDVAALLKLKKMNTNLSPKSMDIVEIYDEINRQLSDPSVVQSLYSALHKVEKVAFIADEPHKNSSSGMSGSSRLNEALAFTVSEAKSSVVAQSPYLVMSDRAKKIFRKLRKNYPDLELTFSTNSLAATDSWPTYALFYKQKKMLVSDLQANVFEFKPIPSDLIKLMPSYPSLLKKATGRKFSGQPSKNIANAPYLCLHAKTIVVDKYFAFVGSYNVDPRSANLNTEVGLVVWDVAFAETVDKSIKDDCKGGNSWVTAEKERIIGLSHLDDLMTTVGGVVESVTTLDVWPSSNSSCFDLKTGAKEVGITHPHFYENYEEVGNFPMLPMTDEKAILVQLFRSLGMSLTPLL